MKKTSSRSQTRNCLLLSIMLFAELLFSCGAAAQSFTLNLFHSNKYSHSLTYYNADNVYGEHFINKIVLKKISDTALTTTLNPASPAFMQLNGEEFMVLPGEHTTLYWNDSTWNYTVPDTTSADYFLKQTKNVLQKIVSQYNAGDDFAHFTKVFTKLKWCADSTGLLIKNSTASSLQPAVKGVIREYIMMRLAHFAVLPILLKSNHDPRILTKLIQQNIKMMNPALWLQTQSGHIFLRTYYSKLLLPAAGYDFKIALKNPLFNYPAVKKYVGAFYFEECIAGGNVKRKEELLSDLNSFKAMFSFLRDEKDETDNIERRINKMQMDIIALFAGMELEKTDGTKLTTDEKKKLISSGNILIDFWASWCRPCREKMEDRKTAAIKINGDVFNTIYLSIDEKRALWANVKYPFFTATNCFRIANGPNTFTRFFQIQTIPRYMLIKNGILLSDRYDELIK